MLRYIQVHLAVQTLPLSLFLQTQVRVQQTALDLLGEGMDVHILADGVSSQCQVDRIFAIEVSIDS